MVNPDVLMFDRIGGSYTRASMDARGLGGSEIEMLQVAYGMTARGHRVVIANGVEHATVEDGVTFVPHAQAWQHTPKRALYLQRFSVPETKLEISSDVRVVVRANDVYCPPYDVHRGILESGRATLVANTKWQADLFQFARDKAIVPPMLEPMPKVNKEKGLFVFPSGAMKGLDATLAMWCGLKKRYGREMAGTRLVLVSPGWGEYRPLMSDEVVSGVTVLRQATPEEYRRWIARAEGLFMVLTMPETFCCAAALAERARTRTHILCRAGLGGLPEAVVNRECITEDLSTFEKAFIQGLESGLDCLQESTLDLRPSTVIGDWEELLTKRTAVQIESQFAADATLEPNQKHLGPLFGDFLSLLRSSIAPGGSEFGVGLTLFSLATSIQAKEIVEIGRFKGFSTLALAAACQLQETGWIEPKMAEQRPDVEYDAGRQAPRVVSIEPNPLDEAKKLLKKAGIERFVHYANVRSDAFMPDRPIDLLFIDGGHFAADVRADVHRYVPWVRPGGYFILHDYFGWFTPDGQNGSPIAKIIAEELQGCDRVLIDTHYASLVIFRKAQALTERWELDPKPALIEPRADGRPTVGLCIIAKGDEASTVATRAIASAKKVGVDCVTVVCDANDVTADVCRSIGADVFIRPSPEIDWKRGIGIIAGARNEALAIAERRTDYVLVLDADDYFEGELPKTLDRDAYEVTVYDGSIQYSRVSLFRSTAGWRYVGIIHEFLETSGSVGKCDALRYVRGKSSYAYQDQDPPAVKYLKHAQLMRKWLVDHPDDPRAQFYLAQSYRDAGLFDEAIKAYEKRVAMLNGWEEERSFASYQLGKLLMLQGKDPTTALLQAYGIGVPKAEPLLALAQWYRHESRRQFMTAYMFAQQAAAISKPAVGVFLEPSVYQYEAAAEVAICAYWIGQKREALERFEALLSKVTQEKKGWLQGQISICMRELSVRG